MANQKQAAKAAATTARQAAQDKKKQQKTIFTVAGIIVLAAVLILGCIAIFGGPEPGWHGEEPPVTNVNGRPEGDYLSGMHYVQIDVQDYGSMLAELDADAAPIAVTNFIKLVKEGFYDGLTFHRVIDGFMIQGGDPNGNGTGGSSEDIWGEFAQNGWNNPIAHERGVLSMARSSDPNSASSQFFIMHQAAPHLDGSYAAFGRVLDGMEVVDAICQNTPVTDDNGTVEKANQPVITSIRVLEVVEE